MSILAKAQAVATAIAELEAAILAEASGALVHASGSLHDDADNVLTLMLQSRTKLDALTTVAATRADESGGTWQGFNALFRSVGKVSEAELRQAYRSGSFAQTYPQLSRLWLAGDISSTQVRHIGTLASKVPLEHRETAVDVLASHAPRLSARELNHAARVLLNAVSPGFDERAAERVEAESFLQISPDLDGYRVVGHLTVEQAGWVRTVLDAHTNVIAADDFRTRSQRQADALVAILRTFAASDAIPMLAMARPQFTVAVTYADLRAIVNDAAPGDLPVTAWGDHLDTVTTRRMLSDADIVPVLVDVAFDAATSERVKASQALLIKRRKSRELSARYAPPVYLRLLTTPVVPVNLGRTVRIVPKLLRDAVMVRDQQCVVDGCTMPSHQCEIHHVRPWALGGATDIDNLATLCVRHHRTVETGTWRLRVRTAADGPGRYWIAEGK